VSARKQTLIGACHVWSIYVDVDVDMDYVWNVDLDVDYIWSVNVDYIW